ncbi:hypothetical protein [Corynebacterium gerontici]|uniref:DUF732 domain-containing protein n=1 Tax=Corynebacterium gerontici TaxID=2079234 RepID=A0A3G6IXV9_9CORY|nr:hypothetical protein [Corynebacterium gerontici]AZA10522.1 hypothetical protein CGERO_00935 [Corynebacterium gerontici]
MKRLAALALALSLTACGSATVEDSPTSVAPLSKTASSSTSKAPKKKQQPSEENQDRPAQEIDNVPDQQLVLSKEDKAYLSGLKDQGVNTEGVERELLNVASLVCTKDDNPVNSATVQAVAGQLVEQGRSDKSFEETAKAIESGAAKAYCA